MKIQRVIAPVGQMQLKSLIEAHVVSILLLTKQQRRHLESMCTFP